jgi:hypothetical protein
MKQVCEYLLSRNIQADEKRVMELANWRRYKASAVCSSLFDSSHSQSVKCVRCDRSVQGVHYYPEGNREQVHCPDCAPVPVKLAHSRIYQKLAARFPVSTQTRCLLCAKLRSGRKSTSDAMLASLKAASCMRTKNTRLRNSTCSTMRSCVSTFQLKQKSEMQSQGQARYAFV